MEDQSRAGRSRREKVLRVTFSVVWGLGSVGKRCHMLRFLGFGGRREKVSRVTVSRVWEEKGKGVTCYGFSGLGGEGKRCRMLRFLWFGACEE